MSKAMILIEFDDEWLHRANLTCDEMLADITIYRKESLKNQCDYTQRIYKCWCPIKPMPSRKEVDCDTILSSVSDTEKVAAIGWNACIDEIVG